MQQNHIPSTLICKLVTSILCAALLASLYLTYQVLLPFILGGIFAYLLSPAHNKLRQYCSNCISALIIVLTILICIASFLFILIPALYHQLILFYYHISNIDVQHVNQWLNQYEIFRMIPHNIQSAIRDGILEIPNIAQHITTYLTTSIIQSTTFAINLITFIILTPFTTFYLLKDKEMITDKMLLQIPERYKIQVTSALSQVDNIFLQYVKGQCIIALLLALYYVASFYLIHMKSAVAVGIIVGILSLIPYAGSIISIVLILLLTLLQSGSIERIMLIAVIFAIGHLLETLFLSPRFLGRTLGLYPVITIASIVISAHFFGLIGMFLAIPFTVIMLTIIKMLLTKCCNFTIK